MCVLPMYASTVSVSVSVSVSVRDLAFVSPAIDVFCFAQIRSGLPVVCVHARVLLRVHACAPSHICAHAHTTVWACVRYQSAGRPQDSGWTGTRGELNVNLTGSQGR